MAKKKVKKKKKKVHVDQEVDVSSIVSSLTKDFEIEVMSADSKDRTPYYIPFRHTGLQMITGGVPGGYFHEFRGKSQTIKSYLLYELGAETISMHGAFMLHDIEEAYQPAYGKRVGLEGNKKFALSQEKKMEKIFELSRRFVLKVRETNKNCPILIGADSYPPIQTILSQKEIDDQLKKGAKELKGYREAKKNALFSNLLGEFVGFLKDNKATFILLNQLKHKIGVIFGDDKTSNADNIVQYYATLRLEGQTIKAIKNKEKTRKVGMIIKWKTIKNRNLPPFKEAETKILYRSGLQKNSGLVELLIAEGLAEKVSGKPNSVKYKGKVRDIKALLKKKPELFKPLTI